MKKLRSDVYLPEEVVLFLLLSKRISLFFVTTEPGLVIKFIDYQNSTFNEIKGSYQTTTSSSGLFFLNPVSIKHALFPEIKFLPTRFPLDCKVKQVTEYLVVNRFNFMLESAVSH